MSTSNTHSGEKTSVLEKINRRFNPPMDHVGQELCRKVINAIFSIGYTIAMVIGVLSSNIFAIFYMAIVTTAVGCLLSIPSWSIYRRNAVMWRGGEDRREGKGA